MPDSTPAPSTDYHDYVIQDGRFIGDFERMYRDCPDPWQQDAVEPISEEVALSLLAHRPPQRVLDIGCGKGRFTHRLKQATGASVTAVDIAATAVQAARARYPGIRFLVADVPPMPFADGEFDLVVAAELLWYVLPRLEALSLEVQRVLAPSGRFLILQTFYPPGEQRYGREIMTTPADLLRRLPFPLLRQVECDPALKWVGLFQRPALEDAPPRLPGRQAGASAQRLEVGG